MVFNFLPLVSLANAGHPIPESLWSISVEEQVLLAVGGVLTIVVTIIFFRIVLRKEPADPETDSDVDTNSENTS